ncbi:PIN domain-containing protein [Bacillus sp. RIT694]|uniref:PIN domain-containing protein n=1 Tax=Bacillus sp. RIT694 TaxID=2666190 RepID=UPI0012ACA00D|nr:PIN domain-containing protein [Bacillus sp. RIT694]MRS26119.1 DUF4935 domain-containing protein [Bacillus sp. RIT694]
MNIFLDTTIMFSDPFLKKNFNRSFLGLTRDFKDIKFYMSEVVYKESKRHFEKNITKHLTDLQRITKNLQDHRNGYFTETIDIESEKETRINEFENFYKELESEGVLHIIPCPNEILSELINRAVNRIKPFQENKSEFRDAATWLTYVNYVEKFNMSDCYFITGNVNDFCDESKKNLHPDLLKDSTKFKTFVSFSKLAQEDDKVKSYIERKQEKEKEIKEWIKENDINENYVLEYFNDSSLNGLFNNIYTICSDYITSLNRVSLDIPFFDGLPILDDIDMFDIQDFNIEVIAEKIIISGELVIEAECYLQNLFRIGENTISDDIPFSIGLLQPFSFILEEDKSMTNLQLEEIGVYRKAKVHEEIYF